MRFSIGRSRSTPEAQQLLPFAARARRLDLGFRRGIIAATVLVVLATVGGTRVGRYTAVSLASRARLAAPRLIGLEPPREQIDALWNVKRERSMEQARAALTRFMRGTTPELRTLFDLTGMDPAHGLIRWGRGDLTFLLSSKVFEADDHGRSFRLRPNTRSVWLRQITMRDGPFSLLMVPDTPEIRESAKAAGGIVDLGSITTTNSWGCRGPEPDLDASMRGIVLGDSFMQGMFVGDDDAPPLRLQHELAKARGVSVSILNTGHISYSPEQYYYSLLEFGDRFRPRFVVVSVCPNDFGDEWEVLAGRGDDWDEADYWLGQIVLWCRGRNLPCVLVPVPCEPQIRGSRKDGFYPGRVCNLFQGGSTSYCDPLDMFINEHLTLVREARRRGQSVGRSPLFNGRISDGHFSANGAELWGQIVARRVALLISSDREAGRGVKAARP
ncbi:MAG: hypothetical protein ABI353_14555 [Isosphaeraceae bacterium]